MGGHVCLEVPGAGEKGFDREHSKEALSQLSLWPQPGAESHVRGHQRRLEIQQASGFELNWDSEAGSPHPPLTALPVSAPCPRQSAPGHRQ